MDEYRRALDQLSRRVEPPLDAWGMLLKRRARKKLANRVIAGVVALTMTIAVVAIGIMLLRSRSNTPASPDRTSTPAGYFVLLPDQPSGYDENGLAILDATTNLPEGTLVDLYIFSADAETPSGGVVKDGRIQTRVANNNCHETEMGLIGSSYRVTVTVSATPSSQVGIGVRGGGSPLPSPMQPPEVQAILGPAFEHLTGDQVEERDGEKYLQTYGVYELPAETCSSKLLYTSDGSFEQVPVDTPIPLATGPFPNEPFASCPDPTDAIAVEAGTWEYTGGIATRFDKALSGNDIDTLSELVDPSVGTFDGWTPSGSDDPQVVTNVPSGNYIAAVVDGCGSFVALRTWGVVVADPSGSSPVTYLFVLRADGWKVWGLLPGGG
jgi:hypothetical protein